jgi:hypothetical protein
MLKTVSSITNAIGALNYVGTWNASTNSPALASGVGTKGDYYVVSVAGSTNLDGETLWGVGDWAVYNGTAWQKVEGGNTINATTVSASTSVTTPVIQATSSAGGTLKNNGGTAQMQWGSGGGSNLSLEVATNINPANAAVAISPTGTGTVTINPATASTMNNVAIGGTTPLAITGTTISSTALTASSAVATDASKQLVSVTNTGTGNNVLSVSPTFTGTITAADEKLTGKLSIGVTTPLTPISIKGSGSYGSAYDVNEFQIFDPSSLESAGYGFYINQSYPASTPVGTFTLGVGSTNNHEYALALATANTTRVLISKTGIVTMSAYGAGAATFSAAGVISSVSDETWKIKDGAPLNPDAMLQKLEPGYWFYNDEKKEIFGAERQLGFYAQNVNEAIGVEAAPTPETYIQTDENGVETTHTKPWGYYDRSVLAVTVMSLQKALTTIQEQQANIETLTNRITLLEGK